MKTTTLGSLAQDALDLIGLVDSGAYGREWSEVTAACFESKWYGILECEPGKVAQSSHAKKRPRNNPPTLELRE